jgi:hypothetical protein
MGFAGYVAARRQQHNLQNPLVKLILLLIFYLQFNLRYEKRWQLLFLAIANIDCLWKLNSGSILSQ